jgi:uncharacterized repeat protein (TIGR03806 family)
MRRPATRVVRCLLAALAAAFSSAAGGTEPEGFTPFDGSRLLGSPDPLPPLEIENAFPALVFTRPVAIASARDGSDRLFVCDQPGLIYVFENRADVQSARVFLDLRDRVGGDHFEEGLLGLAFHPRFRENREFFVYYSTLSAAKARASVIARYRVSADDPNAVDKGSEERILVVPQPYGNHNGGAIEFGPDGKLYVPLGDGGAANDPHENGQKLESLLGKILRIDVDRKDPGLAYAIPPDNPFAGAAAALEGGAKARGEIWAYGLRNPWRMSFDRLTGECWIGDVGQDLWEEIDVIVRGGNYGWKNREGRHDFDPKAKSAGGAPIDPIWEYPRSEGKSITGGVVYRGALLPELYGAYLYGDFVTFNIWALRYDGKQATSNHLIARSSLPVTAFGEDEAGEVYLAALESKTGEDTRRLSADRVFNLNQGRLYRLRRRTAPDVDAARFPRRLSETGLFADLRSLAPSPALIPYEVNVPLWSDGAAKARHLALPAGGRVGFSERGHWEFPVGTVLVKTFSIDQDPGLPPRRLETRLLVRSERGWDGYTYLWNDDGSDARLLDAALWREVPIHRGGRRQVQRWYFPSRSDCQACHTQVAGHVLGLSTRQLNLDEAGAGGARSQLDRLASLGIFKDPLPRPAAALERYPRWDDRAAPREALSRAYLDANCAICHAPGGTGVAKIDLRWHTPLAETGLVGIEPGQARQGPPDAKLIAPGEAQRSELVQRMLRLGQGRMPTLASSRVDWEAIRVLGEWIDGFEE